MYVPRGNLEFDFNRRRLTVAGLPGGLGGLGCPDCSGRCQDGAGLGEEQSLTGALGTWAHGAIDLVTWGFLGLVLWKYFFSERVERAQTKRSHVRAARAKLREARSERGFF